MNILSYALDLKNSAFLGPMRIAQGAVKGFTAGLSQVGNIITGLASLPGAINTLVGPLTQPITLSADMEALETSFKSLLKNGPAARAMVRDLMEFADATPFDPVPVAATGKQLLAFGFAAKQVKPLLRDIGDLAAAMDKPIEEVGDAFGRLRAGQFGEAFERLRAFGITMQELQGQGLEFDKSGSFKGSADQALEAVRQIIQRKFGGGMADLSLTFRGLFSTFSGYWDALQRDFGKPIMQTLKPVLEDGTELLKQWSPIAQDFGKKIGLGIATIREIAQDGKLWDAARLGLQLAGAALVNQIWAGIQGGIAGLTTGFAEAAGILQSLMADPKLWNGLRVGVLSIGDDLRAMLLDAAADMLSQLPGNLGANVGNLREMAALSRGNAEIRRGVAADELSGGDLPAIVRQIGDAFRGTGSAALAGYQDATPMIATGDMLRQINGILTPALASAKAYFDAQQSGDEPARKTAAKTEAILTLITQHGITAARNLQLLADRMSRGDAGTFQEA